MKTLTAKCVAQLQKDPNRIRNICILAHVDHGKTTLADTLVASNGIISQRMAGKMRYLDSREDEQLRGITMKSSAISLLAARDGASYLVNLLDSPGHVDFSSEVSTAVRLCDGALVLVDVAEGVCPQTHAVLRQAWMENIRPVLVLNKMDRLIVELKMTPMEAHAHLTNILEQVNAIMAELWTSEVMESASDVTTVKIYDWSSGVELSDDSHVYFAPESGNVVFASAADGWGFGISHFAEMFAKKLNLKTEALEKTLWGDFYLDTKTRLVKKGAYSKSKKPLFVQVVLENLWAVYDAVVIRRDKEMMSKIMTSLGLKLHARDARHNDARVQVAALCCQWLPLAPAVLDMVIEKLPTPGGLTNQKVDRLLRCFGRSGGAESFGELRQAFLNCCSATDAPTVIFISKMLSIERDMLPSNKKRPLTENELSQRREVARQRMLLRQAGAQEGTEAATCTDDVDEDAAEKSKHVFVALGRVYSGCAKRGQKLFVLSPKYDPNKTAAANQGHISEVTVTDLYLPMGRELEDLEEGPAGCILGLGGLENHILKSATLSSTANCPSFAEVRADSIPIVRVAVEPRSAENYYLCHNLIALNPVSKQNFQGDLGALRAGLKLLNQADPCVVTYQQEDGQLVVAAAGEVHLAKCVEDLTNTFASVPISVSEPNVPFRETIVIPPDVDMVNEAIDDAQQRVTSSEEITINTGELKCQLSISAVPLPDDVTDLLEQHSQQLKALDYKLSDTVVDLDPEVVARINLLREKLRELFSIAGSHWEGVEERIWAFGPRKYGPNILLNCVKGYKRPSIWDIALNGAGGLLRPYDSSVANGFQLTALQGPICAEPLRGVCFKVEKWEVERVDSQTATEQHSAESPQQTAMSTDPENSIAELDALNMTSSELHRQATVDDALSVPTTSCAVVNDAVNDAVRESEEPISFDNSDVNNIISTNCGESSSLSAEEKDYSNAVVKQNKRTNIGLFSGHLMSAVKLCCRKSFEKNPQRLVAAMYTCDINCTADMLGKMFAVLAKRSGRVLSDEMKEGSSLFNIHAVLPVVESFGFAEEIRKRTSGLASPQLHFSHWQVVDIDPYWVPTTEEELTHFGSKADADNQARKYMNGVRRRKGLRTTEQLVTHGEKQRTLSKKA